MVTAYDTPSARIVDRAGVDMVLVGDSLGMVMLGRKDTLSVSLDEMIHHCRAVVQGIHHYIVKLYHNKGISSRNKSLVKIHIYFV